MRLQAIGRRVSEAQNFIEVARIVIELAAQHFEALHSSLALLGPAGAPVLLVDDVPTQRDEGRIAWLHPDRLRADLQYQAMLAQHGPVGHEAMDLRCFRELADRFGYAGPYLYPFLMPLLEPNGVLGTIRCGWLGAPSAALQRDLATLSTYVSVQCAQLGVTTAPEPLRCASLSSRQQELARLAARGYTNREIAAALAISVNTVKKHLKDTFARLDIANRTELSALLSHAPADDLVAAGVTHLEGITITKGLAPGS